MIKDPGQSLLQTSRSACCNAYLRPQIRRVIEFPIAKVRERGGTASAERIEAVGAQGRPGGRFGGVHAGELVAVGGPAADGIVVEAAAPLEDEGEAGKGEGEDGEEEEQPRGERQVRRRRRGERRRGGGSNGRMQTRHGRLLGNRERRGKAGAYKF